MALSASAQNSAGCYWLEQPPAAQPDTASRTANYGGFPSTQDLRLVPIGAPMGHFFLNYPFRGMPDLKCPLDKVPNVTMSYWLEGAQLEPGYSDVYRALLHKSAIGQGIPNPK